MSVFLPADILLPKTDDFAKWAVIACDQFTSDNAYWNRVREFVGDAPSALRLILPEALLGSDNEDGHIRTINESMRQYLEEDRFVCYPNSYIYVERTLENGSIRKGVVGMVDLEAYSFEEGADCAIRATEKTVVERIPPRVRVRRDASLELPHILMLSDDFDQQLLKPIEERKKTLKPLYDFDLMEDGGHISGWLVSEEEAAALDRRLAEYAETCKTQFADITEHPPIFVVGDGNHSLATAKTCYEQWKKEHPGEDASSHPSRYALVELESIHDASLVFEPIHRIVTDVDPEEILQTLRDTCCADNGYPIRWHAGQKTGMLCLDREKGELAVAVLQNFLDEYLSKHEGEIDYIHDDEALIELSKRERAIGFLLPSMEKGQLFRGVIADGCLPRKTFSMGHAREKRYYLEARKIR